MILTGLADEAANDIGGQIEAHRELGWDAIELRLIDGENVAGALDDDAFERAVEQLKLANMQVVGFGSAIGNWSRHITGDFDQDVHDLKIAAERMTRVGCKYIRTMSWLGEGASDDDWRDESINRYRELARIAADHDIYLAHENCTGWGGLSGDNTRHLIEEVDSDHLVVLFDIGNVVSHGYESMVFYEKVKDLIRYIHVKDARYNPAGSRSEDFTMPGEGDARVADVLADQFARGYDGVISIEPHIAKVVHRSGEQADPQKMYTTYLAYARQFVELVEKVKAQK